MMQEKRMSLKTITNGQEHWVGHIFRSGSLLWTVWKGRMAEKKVIGKLETKLLDWMIRKTDGRTCEGLHPRRQFVAQATLLRSPRQRWRNVCLWLPMKVYLTFVNNEPTTSTGQRCGNVSTQRCHMPLPGPSVPGPLKLPEGSQD